MSSSERKKLKTPGGRSTRQSSFSSTGRLDDFDDNAAEAEIKRLAEKIRQIKLERLKLDPIKKYDEQKKCSSFSDTGSVSTLNSQQSSSKRRLYHPKLDSVFIGVANSPYLTNPALKYTKETIRSQNTLRQLKKTGLELKKISDLPFDIEKSKQVFVEALTYSPSFEVIPSAKTPKSSRRKMRKSDGKLHASIRHNTPSIHRSEPNDKSKKKEVSTVVDESRHGSISQAECGKTSEQIKEKSNGEIINKIISKSMSCNEEMEFYSSVLTNSKDVNDIMLENSKFIDMGDECYQRQEEEERIFKEEQAAAVEEGVDL